MYGAYAFELSNPTKQLFPSDGLSKAALADYYETVAARMLPHMRNRALVMQRFPEGIEAEGFYQKQVGGHFPPWIARVRVAVKGTGGHQDLVVCNNTATLAYLVGQACITPHLWLSRCDRLEYPDRLVLDLDPPGDDFAPVRRAALRCRELLTDLGLRAYVKTTGSRGAHVVVPLDRSAAFPAVREFARDLAALLASRHPDELTVEVRKAKRRGRLYLDVGRNAYGQTAVAPYAVRARRGAPVAMPIAWSELQDGRLNARTFDTDAVVARVSRNETDPWAGMGRHARALAGPRRRLRAQLAR